MLKNMPRARSAPEKRKIAVDENNSVVELCKAISFALTFKKYDAERQLFLAVEPKCYPSKKCKKCITQQFPKLNNFENGESSYDPRTFLHFTENCLHANEFYGHEVLHTLIDLILRNDSEDSDSICIESYDIFESVLEQSPPCWESLEVKCYEQFMIQRINFKYFKSDQFYHLDTFFESIINFIEKQIEESFSEETRDTNDSLLQIGADLSFHCFSSEERIQRMVLVLHLLIRILEIDFISNKIWINVTSDTSDVDTKTLPIIMKLFYTLNVSNNENFSLYSIKLNSLVEQCLRIYTKLIYLNDNEAHHIIAGRLVNLITNMFRLKFTNNEDYYNCAAIPIANYLTSIMDFRTDGDKIITRIINSLTNPYLKLEVLQSFLVSGTRVTTIESLYSNLSNKKPFEFIIIPGLLEKNYGYNLQLKKRIAYELFNCILNIHCFMEVLDIYNNNGNDTDLYYTLLSKNKTEYNIPPEILNEPYLPSKNTVLFYATELLMVEDFIVDHENKTITIK